MIQLFWFAARNYSNSFDIVHRPVQLTAFQFDKNDYFAIGITTYSQLISFSVRQTHNHIFSNRIWRHFHPHTMEILQLLPSDISIQLFRFPGG